MRKIGVVTVARSDYGILRPVLKEIAEDKKLKLMLYAGGMHLSPRFGKTINEIVKDGFRIDERVTMPTSSDTPAALANSMGRGISGFAEAFHRTKPDLLLVLGDRFEMFAAAAAALMLSIPLAHLHGGEATEGLIDEAVRHSITKMSHLHFVSTKEYAKRVIQMGEEPWRVTVTGAPALDNLKNLAFLSTLELEILIGMPLSPAPLLVTYHPVTLQYKRNSEHVAHLLAALREINKPVVFTYPNADAESAQIIEAIKTFAKKYSSSRVLINLGSRAYFSLMKHAFALVGNSSSGIIEAASFRLPVINVGIRQQGRLHGRNVIDATGSKESIVGAFRKLSSPSFRSALSNVANLYGAGHAARKIMRVLKTAPLGEKLLIKRFHKLDF